MSYANFSRASSGVGSSSPAVGVAPELGGVRNLEGQRSGSQDAQPVGMASRGFARLTEETKRRISDAAELAAGSGMTIADSCPYLAAEPEGMHWRACFVLAGGKW